MKRDPTIPARPTWAPACCKAGIHVLDERPRSKTRGRWVCNLCAGIHHDHPDYPSINYDIHLGERGRVEWFVKLNRALDKKARARGRAQYERNVGRKDAHGLKASAREAAAMHVQSALSEQAFGAAAHLEPSDIETPGPWPDVGHFFVRSTEVETGSLLFHRPGPNDEESDGTYDPPGIYVLCIGADESWRIAGWVELDAAFHRAIWNAGRTDRPCWWLAQYYLNSMDELPSDEEAKAIYEAGLL
jgi:hypothetical protein